MASLSHDSNGCRRVQFAIGSERRAVRLGDMPQRESERFSDFIGVLAMYAKIGGTPDEKTTEWLAGLDDEYHEKLAAVKLVKSRQAAAAVRLGVFIDAFIERQSDIKETTKINLKQTRRWLVNCFGEGRDMSSIGPAEAEDFRLFMGKGGLSENSIRRFIGRARQIFKAAIRRGQYRGNNPFEGMAATVRADKARQFYVRRDMADQVMKPVPALNGVYCLP